MMFLTLAFEILNQPRWRLISLVSHDICMIACYLLLFKIISYIYILSYFVFQYFQRRLQDFSFHENSPLNRVLICLSSRNILIDFSSKLLIDGFKTYLKSLQLYTIVSKTLSLSARLPCMTDFIIIL